MLEKCFYTNTFVTINVSSLQTLESDFFKNLIFRTQTPTNSDSPVPSLPTDDIRKRVIEELALQDNTATNQVENIY